MLQFRKTRDRGRLDSHSYGLTQLTPHGRPKAIHLCCENGPESRQGATSFAIIFHMFLAAVVYMCMCSSMKTQELKTTPLQN